MGLFRWLGGLCRLAGSFTVATRNCRCANARLGKPQGSLRYGVLRKQHGVERHADERDYCAHTAIFVQRPQAHEPRVALPSCSLKLPKAKRRLASLFVGAPPVDVVISDDVVLIEIGSRL